MNGRAVAATILLAVAAGSAAEERRSGFDFMSPETQAMLLDDMANPGMFAVADGAALWSAPAGADNRACADCHGEVPQMH